MVRQPEAGSRFPVDIWREIATFLCNGSRIRALCSNLAAAVVLDSRLLSAVARNCLWKRFMRCVMYGESKALDRLLRPPFVGGVAVPNCKAWVEALCVAAGCGHHAIVDRLAQFPFLLARSVTHTVQTAGDSWRVSIGGGEERQVPFRPTALALVIAEECRHIKVVERLTQPLRRVVQQLGSMR